VEAQRRCPSQTPRRKIRTGLNPGTGVATASTRHLLFLCVLSTFVASFDWDTLARLCSEPESRLVERCNHYCLHSTVASASFLTCFTDFWKPLYFIAGQATDDNMTNAHYMLDTLGYKHTLRIRNTYCFSTATVVALKCLDITLYLHCLSRFLRQYVRTNLTFNAPYRLFFLPVKLTSNIYRIKRRSL